MRPLGTKCFKGTDNDAQTADRRRSPIGRVPLAQEALEALGAVYFRTAMGNGAGRLQPGRHSVGVFSLRTRALRIAGVKTESEGSATDTR